MSAAAIEDQPATLKQRKREDNPFECEHVSNQRRKRRLFGTGRRRFALRCARVNICPRPNQSLQKLAQVAIQPVIRHPVWESGFRHEPLERYLEKIVACFLNFPAESPPPGYRQRDVERKLA